ncbi:MAG TPA: HAD family hydrolase [Gemmatimonadaceae bacterium]|nr:HAD family hydrolase [Gemmatimonadaceae bacterium]
MTKPPRAALLDVDGTLVDSNDAHARAWVDAFAEFGYDVPFARVRPLVGMGGDKLVRRLVDLDVERGRGKELTGRRMEIFRERYVEHLHAFPEARALLERMKRDGLTLVIATSAKKDEFEALMHSAGLDGVVDAHTTSDDAEDSKPDPDIVAAALEESGCPAGEAIMLGDTPYDVEAARKAGVRVVALRSGGWDDEALEGAIAIYDDAADLLARYDESPFARDGGR